MSGAAGQAGFGACDPPDSAPIEQMVLAGIAVRVPFVVELMRRLRSAGRNATAERLARGWAREDRMVSLDATDREALLGVLIDGTQDFAVLRAVLIREYVQRRSGGP